MALWGTDETNTSVAGAAEQKPTWQKDRDPNGSKGRPAINEEQNTFAANTGWVRRIVKRTNDGTKRVIEELLVATNKAAANPTATAQLPDKLGAANVTSVHFRTNLIAANSSGYVLDSASGAPANLVIDVSFNETVDFNTGDSRPVIRFANSTTNINATAYPEKWDGISSTWATGPSSQQNNTNLITFTVPIGAQTTGNGEFKITATALWLDGGSVTDNVGGDSAILTLAGNRRDGNTGGGGTSPVVSVANAIVLGTIEGF